MSIVIIDYGSGNLHSTAKAFELVAEKFSHTVQVTNDAKQVAKASHIVLPGVGAFGDCRNGLEEIKGITEALEEQVLVQKKPFLGICVGMQLLAEKGLEHGEQKGFGWLKGEVRAIAPGNPVLKIPHMGWNQLIIKHKHPVLEGIEEGAHAYFVHSYHMICDDTADVLAEVDYDGPVTAMVAKANIVGTQFHPEKSQATGLKLIENFLNMEQGI